MWSVTVGIATSLLWNIQPAFFFSFCNTNIKSCCLFTYLTHGPCSAGIVLRNTIITSSCSVHTWKRSYYLWQFWKCSSGPKGHCLLKLLSHHFTSAFKPQLTLCFSRPVVFAAPTDFSCIPYMYKMCYLRSNSFWGITFNVESSQSMKTVTGVVLHSLMKYGIYVNITGKSESVLNMYQANVTVS